MGKLAADYFKIATFCFWQRCDHATEEYMMAANGKDVQPAPTNANGQRWWLVGIGSGVLRQSGYALVARVAARTEDDALRCIEGVQEIARTEPRKRRNSQKSEMAE